MDGLQKEYAELIKTDKNLAIQASIILPATLISYSFGSKLPKQKAWTSQNDPKFSSVRVA